MSYTGVNVGPYDLAAGTNYLQNFQAIPWISVNFKDVGGSFLFKSFLVKKVDNITVGITGVTERPANLEDNVAYEQWQNVLPEVIDTLSNTTDFIILLSTLSIEENSNILKQFPKIKLLISSSSSGRNIPPRRIANALLAQTGSRGKYLGRLTINNPQLPYEAASLKADLKQYQRRLHSLTNMINQARADKDKNGLDIVEDLISKRDKVVQKIYSLKAQLLEAAKSQTASYTPRFFSLSENLAENPQINSLIGKIRTQK